MKKIPIITCILLTLTAFSCKNSEEQNPIAEEPTAIDTVAVEDENPLSGTVYREITEIPELVAYENQAGTLIDQGAAADGIHKYGVSQYGNEKNYVIIFQELVKEPNNPKSKFKILDTLNIAKLNIDEHIATCSCRINKKSDTEIIAIVKAQGSDDIEYYDHVVKAWRADIKTLKIVPIEDLNGIDCMNENYGL